MLEAQHAKPVRVQSQLTRVQQQYKDVKWQAEQRQVQKDEQAGVQDKLKRKLVQCPQALRTLGDAEVRLAWNNPFVADKHPAELLARFTVAFQTRQVN